MNRDPSTTIKPRGTRYVPLPMGARRATFGAVFADGRAAFPHATGFVYITRERAFFQRTGDATPYSIAITADEFATLAGAQP